MKYLVILFLLVTGVFAKGQTSNVQDTSVEFQMIDREDYTIQFPVNWSIDTTKLMGADLVLFSQKRSDSDRFRENVNVMIQDLKGSNVDLDKFVDVSTEQIKNLLTNANIIESTRLHRATNEFHKLIFSGTQGIFTLKTEQYYFVANEKAFVITLTTEKNEYDNYKKVGEMILASFDPKK